MNECRIHLVNEHILKLMFFGDVSHFPSTSNSKTIFKKRVGNKIIPFIAKSSEQRRRLDQITEVFYRDLRAHGFSEPPKFGDKLVFCPVFLAYLPRRHDSHNYSKPIADWLQSVGIVDDDSYCEMPCRKAVEYQHLGIDANATTIYVISKSFIGGLLARQLTELLDVLERNTQLVG